MNPGDSLLSELVCASCGGSRIGLVQRGIDHLPIGKCYDCSAKEPNAPDENDRSAKAEKSRRRIALSQTTRYKPTLTPLIERDRFRAKVKPVEAKPESLWDA